MFESTYIFLNNKVSLIDFINALDFKYYEYKDNQLYKLYAEKFKIEFESIIDFSNCDYIIEIINRFENRRISIHEFYMIDRLFEIKYFKNNFFEIETYIESNKLTFIYNTFEDMIRFLHWIKIQNSVESEVNFNLNYNRYLVKSMGYNGSLYKFRPNVINLKKLGLFIYINFEKLKYLNESINDVIRRFSTTYNLNYESLKKQTNIMKKNYKKLLDSKNKENYVEIVNQERKIKQYSLDDQLQNLLISVNSNVIDSSFFK